MAEVWQTAFGKDFGDMAQGDDKTGQKGTNSMIVMTHTKIEQTYAEKVTWISARRRRTRTESKSRPAEIFSRIEETFPPDRWTYQHQNYC